MTEQHLLTKLTTGEQLMFDYKQLCIELLRVYDKAPNIGDFMDTGGYGYFELIRATLKAEAIQKANPLEDRGLPSMTDDMRAAADWQLERDAEYFAQYLTKHFGIDPEVARIRAEWLKEEKLLGDLKKAMRQQQPEDN